MDKKRTKEALLEFLDYLADKGLMARATVQARKAAASMMLGILAGPEADDVTQVDLDDLASRFANLYGMRYSTGSLNTYKSRLGSALDDFRSYLSNPLAFRPSIQKRGQGKPKAAQTATSSAPAGDTTEARPEGVRTSPVPLAAPNILPIPLRSDLTIFIQGLPFDLTQSEAKKIAAVVTAMALQTAE